MKNQIWKSSPLMKIIYNLIFNLPTPSNISIWWNFGSLLGMSLIIQMMTGMFLSMYYTPQAEMAFDSIVHICRNVNYGWLLRTLHSNGASIFFICLYIHIGRGIYYSSYNLHLTWSVGTVILILLMMTAFMGYVLPWNQMSFWGTTVITNLLSAIPYIGQSIIYWLWGSFAISNATLNRFYTFHFILPFIIIGMVMIHLLFLHQTGSNNPLGLNSNIDKVPFHPYYTYKDTLGFVIMLMILTLLVLIDPYLLSDANTFIPANPLVTPLHIQPEWYFLFAYAILRSVPNKFGGILALTASVTVLMIMPFLNKKKMQSTQFYPPNKILFWSFLSIMLLLTWIGKSPVEYPYIYIGQFLMWMYFGFYIINPLIYKMWDFLLFKT